jgi:apolipoprotein N-acyltransferase
LYFSDWLQKYPDVEILFGVSTSKNYPSDAKATPTARIRNGIKFDIFNSALLFNRNGQQQLYHKSILVSGVEKVPFMKYLGFLKNVFIDLGGASGNLGSQDESSVFVSENGIKIAPVICYESVFGEYVSSYIKKGAGIICVMTNDGWWKNTPGFRQHWSFARLRAVETRRSIARAANTGISGFINQKGDVVEKSGWGIDAALKGKLNVNDKMTFYVIYGDYIGRGSLFLSTLLVLFLVVKRFKLHT